jgi:hypothetical protein
MLFEKVAQRHEQLRRMADSTLVERFVNIVDEPPLRREPRTPLDMLTTVSAGLGRRDSPSLFAVC